MPNEIARLLDKIRSVVGKGTLEKLEMAIVHAMLKMIADMIFGAEKPKADTCPECKGAVASGCQACQGSGLSDGRKDKDLPV